ncbi:MAG: DNA topoisomerase I [Deltaproteobacteria bacterium RBG_16_58_17]|nr:MAG: DNA topoisomerase I [Deltaproteobacteria bacterium RBG_16_58_17]OHE16441.1 MAG: DNA topoisomerase I [Syntrophobacterales bacterium GWC2_56_13]
MNSLIIVESPTKVKTIRKYLGPEYDVRASVGHVKDLPKNTLGIDPEKQFEPTYQVIDSKKKVIADLKRAAAKAQQIFLAPDPDREGEAIAWHIAEEIGDKKKPIRRVLFNDLTRETILEAIAHPRELDFNRYEAQQTRRILDRLVGYQISPILWEKVKRGLSAGRVQSVAVRIICDREAEIRAFVPEEYWNTTALLEGSNPPPFEAKLTKIDGKKAKIGDAARSAEVVAILKDAAFAVASVEKKEVKRQPPPPFTTSKLQQEASRWLRFSAKKTMATAQRLYEGIELGPEGPVGLITYMRTDSVRIAAEALNDAREYIRSHYDGTFLPPKARVFKVAGVAQDAHEAIRPSSMAHPPQAIKQFLSPDQFRLYQLIWNRFLASQMNPALLDQTIVDIAAANCLFRAQGVVMRFPGFTVLYTEGKEDNGEENGLGKLLPEVREGEVLKLISLTPEQKFTQPPPRFSEASLVRELEENGIGRPSTYAAILSTIQEREYARLEKGKFIPTDLGILVTDLLVKNFPRILDVAFTASMETELDRIEEGKTKRLDTLNNFYLPFTEELRKAKANMRNIKREETPTDLLCEKCGKPMVIKWGKNGRFLACTNYPDCKNTKNFTQDEKGEIRPEENRLTTDIPCPLCGKPMLARQGRFGKFLGCSGYPECKHTIDVAPDGTQVAAPVEGKTSDTVCEKCGKPMVAKRGRYGTFLGCSGYPECKNIVKTRASGRPAGSASEQELTDVLCDKCGKPMAVKPGRYGKFLGCTGYPGCRNIMKYKPPGK